MPDPDGPAHPVVGTDITVTCVDTGEPAFITADTRNPSYRNTAAAQADTDGDTCPDGAEDADHDGLFDPGETDPTLPESTTGCASIGPALPSTQAR